MLEKVVNGPPGLDTARAQLELARALSRSRRLPRRRRGVRGGDARATASTRALENALLLIDDRDPTAVARRSRRCSRTPASIRRRTLVIETRARAHARRRARRAPRSSSRLPRRCPAWSSGSSIASAAGSRCARATSPGAAGALGARARRLRRRCRDVPARRRHGDRRRQADRRPRRQGQEARARSPQGPARGPDRRRQARDRRRQERRGREPRTRARATRSTTSTPSSRRHAQARLRRSPSRSTTCTTTPRRSRELDAGASSSTRRSTPRTCSTPTLLPAKKAKEAFELAQKAVMLNPDYRRRLVARRHSSRPSSATRRHLADAIARARRRSRRPATSCKELQKLRR